jgi:hypothetical protein
MTNAKEFQQQSGRLDIISISSIHLLAGSGPHVPLGIDLSGVCEVLA